MIYDAEIANQFSFSIAIVMERLKMLILQRQAGESIWIGNDIQVTVLSNVHGVTRIGITAPQKIHIVREELRNRKPAHAVITKAH